MDSNTGRIRMISDNEKPKPTEKLFAVGEKIWVKDCYFEIINIRIAPWNEITLKGIPKPQYAKSILSSELPK